MKMCPWSQNADTDLYLFEERQITVSEEWQNPSFCSCWSFQSLWQCHHPASEKILAGDSNGDFAEKSLDTRSQRPAPRQQKWPARSLERL